MSKRPWRFAVDRGGTFTDVIGVDPEGRVRAMKLLSESDGYDDAVVEGVRRMLGLGDGESIDASRVAEIRMGTTVATNALLERKGERVALLITGGLRDVLEIGYQSRPEIFALDIQTPSVLYERVSEVDERMNAEGDVVRPLQIDKARAALREIYDSGIRSVAIVFAHAWKNPSHEAAVAGAAREIGFTQVSASHEVMPLIKLIARGQTTLVDAYLSPVLRRYVDRVRARTGDTSLLFMQSSGGLTRAEAFTGKDAILSGPAGGVVGCAETARINGIDRAIGFDMGGTSTDVCHVAGGIERVFESSIDGIAFQTPLIDIHTVAAGGGSVAEVKGGKLYVGPESAGASPGPACYGLGGPLAVTDANVVLGRVRAEDFPLVFGRDRKSPLDPTKSRERIAALCRQMADDLGVRRTPEEMALGIVRVANETMCRPIRRMTVGRGRDVRDYALIAFGGAGGQHACGIARALGMRKIVVPPMTSLLSAYGIGASDHVRSGAAPWLRLAEVIQDDELSSAFDDIEAPLVEDLLGMGLPTEAIEIARTLDLRVQGTDTPLTIDYDDIAATLARFADEHRRHYGFAPPETGVEVVAIRSRVSGRANVWEEAGMSTNDAHEQALPLGTTGVWFEDGMQSTPVYRRDDLATDQAIAGPALIVEEHTTTLVEPGFAASLAASGALILDAQGPPPKRVTTDWDPITLEVFHHRFMGIAEQMGATLERTAHSTNIRERLDFSCAVFDGEGHLVANAPHIPVHLGAMGDSVRGMLDANARAMRPGDVYVTNNPYRGGSHLPDVTVVSPIFDADGKLLFVVANRGHHADIGGMTPGSLPPEATELSQEGVVLDNLLLVRDGEFRKKAVVDALSAGPYPARNIPERLSDLRAQLAANQMGARLLNALIDETSQAMVTAYMGYIREDAKRAMEAALFEFVADGKTFDRRFADKLDDGAPIRVRIRIEPVADGVNAARAHVDFTGSATQHRGNLNAPLAVTRAAVLYVFRTLIAREIPLNEGCLAPIELVVPEHSILRPDAAAAVGAGNVETSQRIVDVLYGALGVAAASQGTMNNFLFGRADGAGKQYYETMAGGSGATARQDGASAVQVHMTNTRTTDVEVLEHRYPEIRVEKMRIRRGSGGAGAHRGGDGLTRAFRFLDERRVTVISERRVEAPYGMAGGLPGKIGWNLHHRADGRVSDLGHRATVDVAAGDVIEINTPGGGGFGSEEKTDVEETP
ncbi:MAG: hydantoinase B/oxoprolinase family protein [Deltaproteobacteria bacterium]|nr:hydantoinase B/oxoprolinase family protein [Deltaproteobacteria bacterium]MCB9478614.1 hydantoinase B/oxoprolinase family protein [Deltaproteobacteria bacterium]